MTAAAKAEHIKIADLVSAYKKELLDYAKGVEAAGGKIAKALEEPVRSARRRCRDTGCQEERGRVGDRDAPCRSGDRGFH